MGTDMRDMNGAIVLHTDTSVIERRLKKHKSYLYSVPYYDSSNGKIIGVDMFFDKSARFMLRKLVDESQLPLF
ncbi:MAG: hypothetical protein JW712_03125 [Dehalococcoidales bacterium]|nr:hypothetical protein [Dehalococcoidales bacterium]